MEIKNNKKYQIIYADPPWRYEHPALATPNRAIENHYPTMLLEDIKKLPIKELGDENCVLFLWATAPKLKECLEVMESWGFNYRTHLIWDKILMGTGYWFRNQHELLLVGIKGTIPKPTPPQRIRSIYTEKRTTHSKKPDHIRDLIKSWYPTLKKIELFARPNTQIDFMGNNTFDGWDVFGNEVKSDIKLC